MIRMLAGDRLKTFELKRPRVVPTATSQSRPPCISEFYSAPIPRFLSMELDGNSETDHYDEEDGGWFDHNRTLES